MTLAAAARLAEQARIFADLPLCPAQADHPRDGRRPCLTLLRADGCPTAHRHTRD